MQNNTEVDVFKTNVHIIIYVVREMALVEVNHKCSHICPTLLPSLLIIFKTRQHYLFSQFT